jgi:hypothetical protein
LPGYPTNPDAILLDSDVRGRKVREIELMVIRQAVARLDGLKHTITSVTALSIS